MKDLNKAQIAALAEQLNESIRSWRLIDMGGGKFVVFRIPDPAPANTSSPTEGEPMRFWRFDKRHSADLFRNRSIVAELTALPEF